MAQVSISQHFCKQCGTSIRDNKRTCPKCGTELDVRYYQMHRQDVCIDSDATIRVAAQPVLFLHADESYNPIADTDATERASAQISTQLYTRAIQQEGLADATEHTRSEGESSLAQKRWLPIPFKETKKRDANIKRLLRRYFTKGDANINGDVRRRSTKDDASVPSHHHHVPRPYAAKNAGLKRLVKFGCGIGVVLLLSLLVLGVFDSVGNSYKEQQVARNKTMLDQLISKARIVGVPSSLLQPVLQQEQQLDSSNNFLAHFTNANAYQNLSNRYHTLSMYIPGIITVATEQAQTRAQREMQNFQTALSRETMQGAGNIESFSQQFSQGQLMLETAKTAQDYEKISQDAREGVLSLSTMEVTLAQLNDFNTAIARLKAARIDVAGMESEYQNDLQLFRSATQVDNFRNLSTLIDAQYQQVVINSVQAFPYVSVARLNELQAQILQFKTYGLDARAYQVRLTADQASSEHTKTLLDDLVYLKQVDTDIASMHDELVRGEALYLVKQFHQEVGTWAKAHPYYDSYDKRTYALDTGYMQAGIGATIDSDLASATTTTDFGVMLDEAQNAIFNLHMLEADYNDRTPYNQVHQTDVEMLDHYNLQKRTVLMVSTVEQAMRIYQNGVLLRSFEVTTGRSELPSLPGVWGVLERKSPIIFQSADPKGSPFWFPDTPIKYAILYHYGGYFVHDAWWRANFGQGTQFPHEDASGTSSYNFDGSHGCVNLSENDAAWVYQHTDWNTEIVIY